MPMKQKEAVAYLRVSGQGQVERGGFPRQRSAINRWSDADGYKAIHDSDVG